MNRELRSRKRLSCYPQSTTHYPPMRRRALTLIEMVTTISVAAVLTGLAMCLLVVMLRAERGGRAHVAEAESLERLADQFRQDVHAAVGEAVVSGKELRQWRLDLSGNRSVHYTIADNGISRDERAGSKDVRRESYALPDDSSVAVAVDRATNPALVSLTIEPKDASLRSAHAFRVEAVLGRDLRFAQRRKEGK